MNIGELFVSLGFDVDDEKLKDFNSKITQGRNEILKLSAAATAGVAALGYFMQGPADRAIELRNYTEQLGYNADALQRWQAVINRTNPSVSLEQAGANFTQFSKNIRDQINGQGNAGALLSRLGVMWSPEKTPEQYAAEIAQNLPNAIKQNPGGVATVSGLLDQLGLGAGAMDALNLFRENQDKFNQIGNGYVAGAGDRRALEQYAETIAGINQQWQEFKMREAAAFGPDIIAGIQQLETIIEELAPKIQPFIDKMGGVKSIAEDVAIFFGVTWAVKMVAAIAQVTTAIIALNTAIAGGALGGLAKLGMLGRLGILGAGIYGGIKGSEYINEKTGAFDRFGQWASGDSPEDIMRRNHESLLPRPSQGSVDNSRSIEQTNTFHVQSTAPADELAQHHSRILQNQLDSADIQIQGAAPPY